MQHRACGQAIQRVPTSPDSDRAHAQTLCSLLLSVLFPVALHCDTLVASARAGRLCKGQPGALAVCGGQRKGWFWSRATVEWFAESHLVGEPSQHYSDRVFAGSKCAHTEPFARFAGHVVLVQWFAFGPGAGVSMGVAPLAQI